MFNGNNNDVNLSNKLTTISSLKNDYLIKNKDTNCDINMNILNNPFISNKFKDKLHEFISMSPSTKHNITNNNKDKVPFERKQKELLKSL